MPSVLSTAGPFTHQLIGLFLSDSCKDVGLKGIQKKIDLASIDLNEIQSGLLHVSVPLKPGYYRFPGLYQDADVTVKPGTMAWLTIHLGQNSNKAVIQDASIELSHSVVVNNPSSAYEKPGWCNGIKDLFASVHIKGIKLSPTGQILFEGYTQKGASQVDIKEDFKPSMFPKLDLELDSLSEKLDSDDSDKSDKTELKKIIPPLSRVLGKATCALKLNTSNPLIDDASFHVKATLNPDGTVALEEDPDFQTIVRNQNANLSFGGNGTISSLIASNPSLTGEVSCGVNLLRSFETQIENDNAPPTEISVTGSKTQINATVEIYKNRPVGIKQSRYQFEANVRNLPAFKLRGLHTRVQGISLQVEGQNQEAHVQARLANLMLAWQGLETTLEGEAKVELTTRNMVSGELAYEFNPSNLIPFRREMGYHYYFPNRLALQPHSSGVGGLLDPEHKLTWAPGSVIDPNSASAGPIGSAEWRQEVEQLAGAPITSGNQVELLVDGRNSQAKRLELIRSAQHTVCMQSLILKDDESGMETVHALIEAKERGVEVFVIIDSLGSIDSVDDLIRENRAFRLLKENGVHLKIYSSLSICGLSRILAVAKRNKLIEGVEGIDDFVNPAKAASTFNLMARIATGNLRVNLSRQDQGEIRQGLVMILGKSGNSTLTVDRLANITPERPLKTGEIFSLFKRILSFNHRIHEKYLIIDNQTAITGGINIADEYLRGGLPIHVKISGNTRPAWRDTDVLVSGEAGLQSYRYFERNWKTMTSTNLPPIRPLAVSVAGAGAASTSARSGMDVQIVQSIPGQGHPHPITNLKIALAKSLGPGDKLYEGSAYFIPIGALQAYTQALKNAVQRGVDVRILTNSPSSTDIPQVNLAAVLCCYRDLLQTGVRIFERTGPRTMHQKVASYGGKVGMIGTNNLDNRSGSINTEDAAAIYNEDFTNQLENMLLDDMGPDVAREIKLAEIKSAPFKEELTGSLWAMLAELM
ncbi:MAG: hypothetical protein JKY15_03955 [Deltaproteobacteria bacterium]|nr:hypothetical protein [Deltaproteobacteria bacterium]